MRKVFALSLILLMTLLEISSVGWAGAHESELRVEFDSHFDNLRQSRKEDVQKSVEKALSDFNQILIKADISILNMHKPSVLIQRDLIAYGEIKVPGLFIAKENGQITVSYFDPAIDISEVLLHELMHWLHYSILIKNNKVYWCDNANYADVAWLCESIARSADLILNPDKAMPSEKLFLRNRLQANLTTLQGNHHTFGLIGLWTRYLLRKADSPVELLKNWLTMVPDKNFYKLRMLNAHARTRAQVSRLSIIDLYYYFTLALTFDTMELNQEGLYSLGSFELLTSAASLSVQMSKHVRANECIKLNPLEYLYVSSSILQQDIDLRADLDVRVYIIRGRNVPLDISNTKWSASDYNKLVKQWNRIHIFNASMQIATICFSK